MGSGGHWFILHPNFAIHRKELYFYSMYIFKYVCIFKLKMCNFFFFGLCWVLVAIFRFSSSCGERGLLFLGVPRLLIAGASLVVEHRL